MASLSVQTLLVLLVFVTASYCMIEEASAIEGQREFDYFALSLQWPGTYCRRTRHCCSKNACCRGANAPTEFTIHGLWPDYNDGTWPSCCYRSDFKEKEISTLHDALEKYWPSLSCGSISNCYEKHGTCSSPVVHDEYSYFSTTLNVYFKYNVTKVLNEAGYVPSNSEKYPLGGIVSAIENAFHTTPQLVCSKGALEELRLCFYKDFKPRDCVTQNDMYSSKSSCPKYLSLPAYDFLGHDGAETEVSWVPDNEGHEAL
uniref:Uncharacterized protein n=1 Tax=Salix viminalis TaxID=40686 RepID=A0A6N2MPZ5_SALVM